MTSPDFAAAQQRLQARKDARIAQRAAGHLALQNQNAALSPSWLPSPVRKITWNGLKTWDTINGSTGTRPAFRVGQVDAELLDEELLALLRAQVGEGLKFFGSHIQEEWSSEILLALRTILFKVSIWDHNASYGATLQDLRYTDARAPSHLSIAPSRWQKATYGFVTVIGKYGWDKWESWLSDRANGQEQPDNRVRLLSKITSSLSSVYSFAALLSFLVFLVNGRYRTLLDRLLRMRLSTPIYQVRRDVSFEYLNRQLVWHAFTEFLLFLLPLVGIGRWRRWLSRAWRNVRAMLDGRAKGEQQQKKTSGELAFLPERTCAICYKDQTPDSISENDALTAPGITGGMIGSANTDVTNPYQTPCGCIYCYVCLATRLEAQEGEAWTCLRCGKQVGECQPWNGDVLQAAHTDRAEGETLPTAVKT